MKIWLSNVAPPDNIVETIWVKNSWETFNAIKESESKVTEAFRSNYDMDETMELMAQNNIEYIYLDSIPESVKLLEQLVKHNKKFFRFCFCGDKNYYYDDIEKIILKNQFVLDWGILSKPY